jgi:hypothetical protein
MKKIQYLICIIIIIINMVYQFLFLENCYRFMFKYLKVNLNFSFKKMNEL